MRKEIPLHVTVRILGGLPRMRRARAFRAIRSAIAQGHKSGFSVVHFSVMSNHVHLIVEADDTERLSRGMQGLKIRMAKRLNRVWGRTGSLFAERYHAVALSTPTQVRNGLCYVLNNARKHGAQCGRRYPGRWVDPFSSARQFDGWRQRVRAREGEVQAPDSWLLRTGWKRRGLLDAHAVPSLGPP